MSKWYPGKAITKSVVMSNTISGASMDFTELVFEISVQASLYDYTSFCEVTVFDAQNFLSNFPVEAGNAIKIKVEYSSGMKEYEFYVTKVKDIVQKDKERMYTIEAISKLGFESMSKKWSAAYYGTTSQMARNIFDQFGGGKVGIWDASKGIRTFVSPNWTPLKALGYLAGASISTDGKNRMVFFEDTEQRFYFCPVETLGKQGSKLTYTYNQYTTDQERGTWDDDKILKTPYSLKHIEEYNWLDAVNRGNLSTAVIQTDVARKSLNYWYFNYWEQWDQTFHLNPKPLWNHQEIDPGKIGVRNHFNNWVNWDQDYMLEDDSISRPSNIGTGQTIELVVAGNQFVDVGQVITVNIPPPEPEAKQNGGKRAKYDVSWSGKYYILAKRDVYYKNKAEKTMALTCVKESLMESDAT